MKNTKKIIVIFLSILLLLGFAKALRTNYFLKIENNIKITQLIQQIKSEHHQTVSAAVTRSPIPRGGIQVNYESELSEEFSEELSENNSEENNQSLPMFGESIWGFLAIILGTLLIISSVFVRYLVNRKFYLDLDGEDS